MIDPGDYGPVRVTTGQHAGRVGYYDDDGDDAVVYLGAPFVSPYVLIPHDALERTDSCPDLNLFTRTHPEVAAELGVSARRTPL